MQQDTQQYVQTNTTQQTANSISKSTNDGNQTYISQLTSIVSYISHGGSINNLSQQSKIQLGFGIITALFITVLVIHTICRLIRKLFFHILWTFFFDSFIFDEETQDITFKRRPKPPKKEDEDKYRDMLENERDKKNNKDLESLEEEQGLNEFEAVKPARAPAKIVGVRFKVFGKFTEKVVKEQMGKVQGLSEENLMKYGYFQAKILAEREGQGQGKGQGGQGMGGV